MDSHETLTSLLDRLHYEGSPNLISGQTPSAEIPSELSALWEDAHEKFDLDAAYFIGNAPVIYFKRFEEPKKPS